MGASPVFSALAVLYKRTTAFNRTGPWMELPGEAPVFSTAAAEWEARPPLAL